MRTMALSERFWRSSPYGVGVFNYGLNSTATVVSTTPSSPLTR
jgi:hypothetical protein